MTHYTNVTIHIPGFFQLNPPRLGDQLCGSVVPVTRSGYRVTGRQSPSLDSVTKEGNCYLNITVTELLLTSNCH